MATCDSDASQIARVVLRRKRRAVLDHGLNITVDQHRGGVCTSPWAMRWPKASIGPILARSSSWVNAAQCLVRLIDPVDLRFKHRSPTRHVITPHLRVELHTLMDRGCESSIHGAWAVLPCISAGSHNRRSRAPPASRISEGVLWGYWFLWNFA